MRYIVTPPVKGGFAWWCVRDSKSNAMPNMTIASFFKGVPDAELWARDLCARMNGR